MSRFDAWEPAVRPPEDYLMHFRTKGSKNGVRKYQNPDGTWTELGLQERAKREGWGEKRQARKIQKAEKHKARIEAKIQAREAKAEKKRQSNIKNLSDSELQARINRLKMENEYKELKASPLLKIGSKIVTGILEAKDKKLKQEMDRANLVIREKEAKAKLINAKAANMNAKTDLIDNVFSGKGKKKAKKELIEAKSKYQVRGAIRKAASNVISKEGQRFVNDMDPHSIVMRTGRGVKKVGKAVGRGVGKVGKAVWKKIHK